MCGDGRGRGRGRDFPLNRPLQQQNLPPPSSRPWGLLAWLGLAGGGGWGAVVSVRTLRSVQEEVDRLEALRLPQGPHRGLPSPAAQTSMSRSPGHHAAYIQGRAESQPRPALGGGGATVLTAAPAWGPESPAPPSAGHTWDRASEGHLDVSTKPTAGSVGAGYRREVTSGRYTGGPDNDATAIKERVGEAPQRARACRATGALDGVIISILRGRAKERRVR